MDTLRKQLIDKALQLGAEDAIGFTIDEIVFDERTLLKCLYGCEGGLPYCPTAETSSITQLQSDLIKKYKWGILIQTDNLKDGHAIALELERIAFLAGNYFALAAAECESCEECTALNNEPCSNPKKIRPPLYALGIDVYKTVRGKGWTLEVVQEKSHPRKNITAVFVE